MFHEIYKFSPAYIKKHGYPKLPGIFYGIHKMLPSKPKEKQFYLQYKSYCGDCLLWWKHNNCGYVLDIREAKVFTEQEANEKCRQSDMLKKWDKKLIDKVAELHVNNETI